ncbi:hypothetical protein JCM10296v2_003262 [Rhodotorula toruloides]
MPTWLTVFVACLAGLASGWERVLQADRAIDRWTAETTKSKSALFVAGLVCLFYAIAVSVILSWTTIGRRVSYRIVSSSLPFEGFLQGAFVSPRAVFQGKSLFRNWIRSTCVALKDGRHSSRSLRLKVSHVVEELLITLAAVRAAEHSKHRSCAKFCDIMRTFPLNAGPEALAVLCAPKVEPLRTLWEGFTNLPQLDLRLIAEFREIALFVNEADAQHRIKTGAPPGYEEVRAIRILKYVQRDLSRRVETYTSLMGLGLRRLFVLVILLAGGSTHILSCGHAAELAAFCYAWWAINDSTRHSLLHNENGLAFLDRVQSLAMSMFRLLEFDDLVIATLTTSKRPSTSTSSTLTCSYRAAIAAYQELSSPSPLLSLYAARAHLALTPPAVQPALSLLSSLPHTLDTRAITSLAHYLQGETESAVGDLEELLADLGDQGLEEGDETEGRFVRGVIGTVWVLEGEERREEGIEILREAVELGKDQECLGILSHLYISLNLPHLSSALLSSPSVTAITSDSLLSQLLVARSNLATGPANKYQDAYYVFEEIKGMQGGRGEGVLAGVAVAQAALGRWEEARDATNEALEMNPTHPTALANSAALALHTGKTAAAADEIIAQLRAADASHPLVADLEAKSSLFDDAASRFAPAVTA